MSDQRATLRSRPCRHCGKCLILRPRGLCWTCYYDPKIRVQYPTRRNQRSAEPRHVPGEFDLLGRRPLPPKPTGTRPGREKIAILARRASRKLSLWHPADEPLDRESRRLGIA